MEENKVKVTIMGQSYNIKGDAPPEYILELAEYVNKKIDEVKLNTSNVSSLQLVILVALNIADEYFQLKKINNGIEGAIEEKARQLISLLDEGLIGDIFGGITSQRDGL
ncbi:MAG TPA: cell division protein ZapA [Spirochaetota bacterium]|jgi:cell division protein ZapA|nr:cell division protein ZapA [Spirochaetota bacterium]OQA96905.1 MAG: Cell division protein ZapA [Spirochaetes bacterium ADurb.Bin218]HOK01964.1 cell division protein ZapA [Spirochaetota bacterium]HOK91640.1 cell division protein ZapA [Spirochaetota bacterium]HON15982.1 cell division protein ZapA [Spirochaetota bacterium]